LPVPGGDDQQNTSFYKTETELKLRVAQLRPGMNKALVFSILGREERDFSRLDRPAITAALYGGSGAGFNGTLEQQEKARLFLQSLEGYRLPYRSIDKEHGFTSPIRVKTNERGYNYVLTLIFQNGVLFDQPSLSGGKVEESSSRTFFDYLSPGLLISR
ncbi:MAG TPA: hypothetical protein VIF12_06125, partial [Micavibrio sp.]